MAGMENFVAPRTDVEAEKRSFMYHQKYVNTAPWPKCHAQALQKLEVLYRHAQWEIPKDWRTRDHVRDKIMQANQQANPGVPLCESGSTIEDVINVLGIETCIDMVHERMSLLLDGQYDSDPVRVFVKQEPHTREKAEIDRWRLIWLVSFVDQIIDAILFDPSLDAEIKNHEKIPSKTGWTWHKGGMRRLYTDLDTGRPGMKYGSLDKKFWDWSAHLSVYDADEQTRKRTCITPDCKDKQDFFFIMTMRYDLLKAEPTQPTGACMQFSDGQVFLQTAGGIVKSGSKITISLNGRGQIYLKICFCEETQPDGYVEELHKLASMGMTAWRGLVISMLTNTQNG